MKLKGFMWQQPISFHERMYRQNECVMSPGVTWLAFTDILHEVHVDSDWL